LPAVRSTLSSDPSARGAHLDESTVRELSAVTALLEALAVRLAPPSDAPHRAALRAANARLRAARDPVTAAIADREVHRRLVEPCADERLLATLRPVQAALRRVRASGGPSPRAHAAEHDAIIDALAARDTPLASERLRAHVAGRLPDLLAGLAGLAAGGDPGALAS
jgi:DNA-binding GntR family transcriptional regulator